MPAKKEDLPSTLERSPEKVQKSYEETLDSAHEQYDSEERAHRTAWSAVKHVAEKKGDHWELKDEKGPSDPQAARSGRAARDAPRETHGGVDANKTKQELARTPARPGSRAARRCPRTSSRTRCASTATARRPARGPSPSCSGC